MCLSSVSIGCFARLAWHGNHACSHSNFMYMCLCSINCPFTVWYLLSRLIHLHHAYVVITCSDEILRIPILFHSALSAFPFGSHKVPFDKLGGRITSYVLVCMFGLLTDVNRNHSLVIFLVICVPVVVGSKPVTSIISLGTGMCRICCVWGRGVYVCVCVILPALSHVQAGREPGRLSHVWVCGICGVCDAMPAAVWVAEDKEWI